MKIKDMIKRSIANNIKRARIESNMTQAEAAEKLGLTAQAISNFERGINGIENSILVRMCEIYNTSMSAILGEEPEHKETPAPKGERLIDDKNVLRIAGRDGSYIVKVLTDEQMKAFMTMVDHLPDACEDL